ncbi:unnamed protein product, partial [Iphiclides podalirius]
MELIDNEIKDDKYKEAGSRVWQLINKYYTALVRVLPLIDGEEFSDIEAEAHVIYLTENEGAEVAEARRVLTSSVLRRGAVHLALVESAEITESLVSWGVRARYEVVALRGEGAAEAEGEERGVARARAALHAHVWPSLRRRGAPPAGPGVPSPPADDCESSGGEGEGEGEEGEEGAVERAEAFAEALGALAALGAARGARLAEQHDGLRLERASQLVAAFCRALGHDLDAC